MADSSQQKKLLINFSTSGIGGMMAWLVVHPVNTLAIRLNLHTLQNPGNVKVSFVSYVNQTVKKSGVISLYDGLSAGLLRQVFYATSRLGLFEVFRDELAKVRPTDFYSRLFCGVTSGGLAAMISCPAEVTLVRLSNDSTLPIDKRRNYTGVTNAFTRIMKEEGFKAFFSGSGPFVNRAMLVGAVQVGTYDQFRDLYKTQYNITHEVTNVFAASMTSGIIYSLITMPFESAKNRMAFQKPDPVTKILPYRGVIQTIGSIARSEGVLSLWAGFSPYYLRCGGHTVLMFLSVEWLRRHMNDYFK